MARTVRGRADRGLRPLSTPPPLPLAHTHLPPPPPPNTHTHAGLLIEFPDPQTSARRSATFLPEVAAHEGWDRAQTLDHLIRKAGYGGPPSSARARLRMTRYQSTTCALSYDEYCRHREPAHGRRFRARQQLVAVGAAQ